MLGRRRQEGRPALLQLGKHHRMRQSQHLRQRIGPSLRTSCLLRPGKVLLRKQLHCSLRFLLRVGIPHRRRQHLHHQRTGPSFRTKRLLRPGTIQLRFAPPCRTRALPQRSHQRIQCQREGRCLQIFRGSYRRQCIGTQRLSQRHHIPVYHCLSRQPE